MEAIRCFASIRNPANLLYPSELMLLRQPKPRVAKIARILIPNFTNERTLASPVDGKAGVSVSSTGAKPPEAEFRSFMWQREGEECEGSRIKEDLEEASKEALEWRLVCSQVSSFASTEAGREACRSGRIPIGGNQAESQKLLDQTAAAVLLLEKLDFSGVDDVTELARATVDGKILTVRELCVVGKSLRFARGVLEQLIRATSIKEGSDRYFPLLDILQNCDFLTELANKIGFCIDCNLSLILDRASSRLTAIRSERRQNMEKLELLLKEESIKVFQANGIDSPLITKRRNRMCIGVKASHKSLLCKGVLLSSSNSGATYFMEPEGAVQMNNAEVMLSNSEKAEELAILGMLSSEIRESEIKIRFLMEKILELDLACSRGAYALWIDGVCPTFSNNEKILSIDIEGIHHPLLIGALNTGSPSSVASVPVDIKVEAAIKVVVISGPNTGGKTATLKILGLASLMSKAGMFLPAKMKPRIPWFDQILADIGDHQSLEHNLSTFSGHISCICKIIQVATKESLVLIDEIGSGTDPSEGVTLSSSILQYLAECINLVVVTTHYADLSLLEATDSRFENATMEFCLKTLRPTYHILWGSTGDSNALSIAKSIGFDQKVLDRAEEWVKNLAPDKQKKRQSLLYQSLVEERSLLEHQAKEAASLLFDVNELYLEIQAEARDLCSREAALKKKCSQNLQQELRSARSQMESVIKNFEVKLHNSEPNQFNSLLRQAESTIASIVAAYQTTTHKTPQEDASNSSYAPKIGERVYFKGFGDKVAIIVEALKEDDTIMVQCGRLKVRVKKNDTRPIPTSTKDKATSSGVQLLYQEQKQQCNKPALDKPAEGEASFGPAIRTSKNTVDLRGMRVEDASLSLQTALSASKSNSVLFIIHGMGTGAVKRRVLEILKSHPRVVRFEEESPMNYGCTLAFIR